MDNQLDVLGMIGQALRNAGGMFGAQDIVGEQQIPRFERALQVLGTAAATPEQLKQLEVMRKPEEDLRAERLKLEAEKRQYGEGVDPVLMQQIDLDPAMASKYGWSNINTMLNLKRPQQTYEWQNFFGGGKSKKNWNWWTDAGRDSGATGVPFSNAPFEFLSALGSTYRTNPAKALSASTYETLDAWPEKGPKAITVREKAYIKTMMKDPKSLEKLMDAAIGAGYDPSNPSGE